MIGFVAIDDIRFNQFDVNCEHAPPNAIPTTTTTVSTTIVTEPPLGNSSYAGQL
jgi:hypothetical protein